jgi:hypothetical protein
MTRSTIACVVVLASGCALFSPVVPARLPRSTVAIDAGETADCQRPSARRSGVADLAVEGPLVDGALAQELTDVPEEVRRTARAAGLEPLLARLIHARKVAPDDRSVELVAMRLQVVMRISTLEIELDSLLFEAECTGNQMETVLNELDRRQRKQELTLTIASIAVAALAGLGAGLWDLRGDSVRGPAALGIAGGMATAVLGGAAFVPARGRVVFPHPRNLFGPILTGADPEQLYPAFVFRMLATANGPGDSTPRHELLRDWQGIIDDSIPEPRRELARQVLYGAGGVYDGDLVDVRERMYDALESQLNAFDRDLELLYRFFGRVLEDPLIPSR